jgi:hypothetical protein
MRRALLAAVVLGVPLGPVRGADDARAVIVRAVQAQGGEAQLRRVHAVEIKIKGTYYDGENTYPFVGDLFRELPRRFKSVVQADGGGQLDIKECLNGEKGWWWDKGPDADAALRDADSAVLRELQLSAYLNYVDTLVPLLNDAAFTLKILPESKVQDRPVVGVAVTSKDRPEIRLYFDKSNGLLVKTEHRRADPGKKEEVLREEYFSDYREVHPAAADEQILKAAKLETNDAGLLDLVRKNTLPEERRAKLRELIRRLGDSAFEAREKAKDELIAMGPVAVPLLTQAAKDSDPEVSSRAKECLTQLGKAPDASVTAAALRLLARRKPVGAVEALRAYLPGVPEAIREEAQAALAAVSQQDDKPEPASGGAPTPGRRVLIPGLLYAMKGEEYRDGKKSIDWEVTDLLFFNRFADELYAKP